MVFGVNNHPILGSILIQTKVKTRNKTNPLSINNKGPYRTVNYSYNISHNVLFHAQMKNSFITESDVSINTNVSVPRPSAPPFGK